MDEKIAHLGFVQGVITRMANNSFLVKGWTVALVAAILALSSSSINAGFAFIAFLPIIVFWWLDSYYLKQERLFRELYKAVVGDDPRVVRYSMDTRVVADKVSSTLRMAFTISILPFYLLVTVLLLVLSYKSGSVFDVSFFKFLYPASQ
ncbi:hypothetical protein [Pseudomonas protegens]|uniref:hypothetical protein n=1 Tax=Pseudomonas protegens TaxID=380021 RepID=UPI00275FBFFD|nr:hypothetical protein [Pseudomonas protegens]MDP9514741.1 hypothetical protein [Pseudomonas protegens]